MVVVPARAAGGARPPQDSFYTLSPERPQEHDDTGTPAAITIATVTVPEIVDRPQFVLRVDANQVTLDEFARWAEPLKSQIRRGIAAGPARRFRGALVSGAPQTA